MSIDGSAPTKLEISSRVLWLLYSPDGKSLWGRTSKGEGAATRLGFEEFPSGGGPGNRWIELPRVFLSAPLPLRHQWAPAGDALACNGFVDGVHNIWVQPLAGGAARPLTRFKSGHVLDFDWSADGKRLFMVRGEITTDIVLITDFR
jgi:hypothetical protein